VLGQILQENAYRLWYAPGVLSVLCFRKYDLVSTL